MGLEGWIDPASHWKATGQVDSTGRMTDATVIDHTGAERTRNATFSSKADFINWVKRH